jgi:hypothetical protein
MDLDDLRARRRDLVARLGLEQAQAILGPGAVEMQFRNVYAVIDHAEQLGAGATSPATPEASAVRRERDWRPKRTIFVETAGQVSTRRDIAETQLQRLQQRLGELVVIAHETGLWDPSPRVLAGPGGGGPHSLKRPA